MTLLDSKDFERCSDRRYLPAARTELSEIYGYRVCQSMFSRNHPVVHTVLWLMPLAMTCGASSENSIKVSGDSRMTEFSPRMDDLVNVDLRAWVL